MSVAIRVGERSYAVGTGAFFGSVFSTIFVCLEGTWGSKFPAVMNELHSGCLARGRVEEAQDELAVIRSEFAHHLPSEIVWDHEKREVLPPWGDRIAPTIKSLADYWVASAGRNLFDVLADALKYSREIGADVLVR